MLYRKKTKQAVFGRGGELGHAVVATLHMVVRESLCYKVTPEQMNDVKA